jgi:hypothetical protein
MSRGSSLPFLVLFFGLSGLLIVVGCRWARRRLLRDIPEMSLLSDEEDRVAMLLCIEREVRVGLVEEYLGFGLGCGAMWAALRLGDWFGVTFLQLGLLIPALFVPLAFIADYYVKRNRIRRYVRRKLAEIGVPVCRNCGYDLRGQVEPRCPECGTPFDSKLLKSNQPSHEGCDGAE